jgi:tRNA(adenine34) deaminase
LRHSMQEAEDRRFMEIALKLAGMAAKAGEVPVGALVVRSGQIIGTGRNSREAGRDPTLHAEIAAIRQAAEFLGDWRLAGCTLYVTLEPCPMCAGALLYSRIRRLVFGCSDPRAGACGTLYDLTRDPRFNHKVLVRKGILSEECARILREFFLERRKSRRDGRVVEGGRLEID